MTSFGYVAPVTLEGVTQALAADPGAVPYAGGVDLVPKLRDPETSVSLVVDLKRVPGLDGIEVVDGALVIGPLVTHRRLAGSPAVREHAPALAAAAAEVGSVQVRNRGTIGGNVCAGAPTFDLLTVLAALDASFDVMSQDGSRSATVPEFVPTYAARSALRGQVLTAIRVPVLRDSGWQAYRKFQRSSLDPAVVGVAVSAQRRDGDVLVRAAAGNYADRPMVATLTADQRDGGVAATLRDLLSARPAITDVRASAAYRQRLLGLLLERMLEAWRTGRSYDGRSRGAA